jgi:hypothetical protein
MNTLETLLERKRHAYADQGFKPTFMPEACFDFQRALIEWSVIKGRSGIFADCGLGKSLMQLTLAENVVRKMNKPVLLMTPLAVSAQMVEEANKFGIESYRSNDGKFPSGARVVVTNYERLHHFDSGDFIGAVCDESSILKNCDGIIKAQVTDFMRKMSFRLLCTATPSPNDLIELGTSSEALGYMGFNDMLSTFFKKAQDRQTHSRKDEYRSGVWRFKGHADEHFFRWICSWARAVRKPSDLGFSNDGFDLPKLIMNETTVYNDTPMEGFLLTLPAVGLSEQRKERRHTLGIRCEEAAKKCNAHDGASVAWCQLNDEGDELERLIPGSVQVSGSDDMEFKEEAFASFASGKITKLVTKPDIAGFGLNWQHCHHQTFFPSHSFEQLYQAIRRSWRFGQKHEVTIDLITSDGEQGVLKNIMRKSHNADVMFESLVRNMGKANHLTTENPHTQPTQLPSWLS